MNQHDTSRIHQNVIKPLEAMYGKFNDEAAKMIIEDLAVFSDDVLRMAAKKVRQNCKSFPKIAHIIEACNEIMPRTTRAEYKQAETHHCMGKAEIDHPNIAAQILSTPAGRLAIELGVASDLMTEYERTGKRGFDESYVKKCRNFLNEAAEELAKAQSLQGPHAAAFTSLFNVMREREKKIYEKFKQAA